MNDTINVKGHINLKLYGPDGSLKQEIDKDNVVTTAGKNALALWLTGATQSDYFMRYVALGTSSTAASAAQTALVSETGTRVAGTVTSSTNILQVQATFGAGVTTGALTECGLFNQSSGGTMFARQTFGVLNKEAGDTMTFTWSITLS